jgi:hypothetical protein
VLALTLQSTTCHFHSCTGDCRHEEDDEDDGSQAEMLVLPPLRPFGLPLTGPIPLPRRTGDQFR